MDFNEIKNKYLYKIDRKRKYLMYCSNCGKYGHIYKKCNDAITSLGIVAFKVGNKVVLNNGKLKSQIYDMYKTNIPENFKKDYDIQFLLIKRKHTLGYIEFIRGRYILECKETIESLFKLMTEDEIKKIARKDFNLLWNELWLNDDYKIRNYKNEYDISKKKYNELSKREEYNLDYFLKEIKPRWKYSEWGFPKGRRNLKEKNIESACREFMEETSYKEGDFETFENIKQISEIFHGTNGILYKHTYYVAKVNKVEISESFNRFQMNEIGDIRWFSYEDAMKVIRPYHYSKKNILTKTYLFLSRFLREK
jgi:8-oxo-dGTP pyrophosphatase MutT (NUDIX family)